MRLIPGWSCQFDKAKFGWVKGYLKAIGTGQAIDDVIWHMSIKMSIFAYP